ncbi:MAG: nitrous oxide-stimulated promoter family protein [Desulfobulbaceae bacterium]|nr:nitrous oxide-stimulated promoter family protein [Desulfobulbaceae bacterium]
MSSGRIEREKATIQAMISIYCHLNHNSGTELCNECLELRDYALRRLGLCPFQEGKTTCGKCTVHCYRPDMRVKIQKVMREIGPRMLWHHPLWAIFHLLDGLRKTPRKPKKK